MSSIWVFVFNLIILFSLYQSCPFIGDSEKANYDLERMIGFHGHNNNNELQAGPPTPQNRAPPPPPPPTQNPPPPTQNLPPPTRGPSLRPTKKVSSSPTKSSTKASTVASTSRSSFAPTKTNPTVKPISRPSFAPIKTNPTVKPTSRPSFAPTKASPTAVSSSRLPTNAPTTIKPTTMPTSSSTQTSLCKITNYSSITPTKTGICAAYKNVLSSFTALLPAAGASIAGDFTRSNILAKAVRLAFHDAGEMDIRTSDLLGPDGCLSNDADNAGLLAGTIVDQLFEPIFQQNCNLISRADFWALLGWLAVNIASGSAASIKYQYGRKDAVTCPLPATRLPSAQMGRGGISQYFQSQLGLTLTDAVTLMGGHTLGRVHREFSGYGIAATPTTVTTAAELQTNAWDTTPQTFDNNYYTSMVGVKWDNNRGGANTVWTRGPVPNIMLNPDMVLGFNATATTKTGQSCGPYTQGFVFAGCANPTDNSQPDTVSIVRSYTGGNGNTNFLTAFSTSFQKLLSVGYGTGSSKLGELVDLDLTTC